MIGQVGSRCVEGRWVVAVFILAAGLSVVAAIVGSAVGVPTGQIYAGYFTQTWLLTPPILVIALVGILARALLLRIASPLAECKTFLVARLGAPDRAIGTLGPILLIPVLMAAFGTLKQVMPLAREFTWDDTFAEWGRLLFFGYRPWQLTHAVFGGPVPTMILDRIYTYWVPLLFFVVLGTTLFAPVYLRARFFLSFALSWLLIGVVGAFVFSSAGPCFSAMIRASSAPDYAELMARLRAINAGGYSLGAIEWQDYLWKSYSQSKYGFGLGISAMPSMHNAICGLYVLATWRANVALRIGARLSAVTILIGSVHLGWHYLVDGLFAWTAAAAVWWLSGAYLKWVRYSPESGPVQTSVIASAGPNNSPDLARASHPQANLPADARLNRARGQCALAGS